MANDALDPGPDGDFPFLPRNPDGTVDAVRFPERVMRHRGRSVDGRRIVIDTTPRNPDGTPQAPPSIPREGDTP